MSLFRSQKKNTECNQDSLKHLIEIVNAYNKVDKTAKILLMEKKSSIKIDSDIKGVASFVTREYYHVITYNGVKNNCPAHSECPFIKKACADKTSLLKHMQMLQEHMQGVFDKNQKKKKNLILTNNEQVKNDKQLIGMNYGNLVTIAHKSRRYTIRFDELDNWNTWNEIEQRADKQLNEQRASVPTQNAQRVVVQATLASPAQSPAPPGHAQRVVVTATRVVVPAQRVVVPAQRVLYLPARAVVPAQRVTQQPTPSRAMAVHVQPSSTSVPLRMPSVQQHAPNNPCAELGDCGDVKTCRRKWLRLALKYHPDKEGGTTDAMQKLNGCKPGN